MHVGADIHEAAKAKLEEIAQARGFEGRLVVHADPQLAPGDCRIEWAEGGVNRDEAAILATIEELVGRYTAARLDAAKPTPTPTPNKPTENAPRKREK